MTSQTTIPALDPLPAVVEALRAAGVRFVRSRRFGVLVGVCSMCRLPTVYVAASGRTALCFGCGSRLTVGRVT